MTKVHEAFVSALLTSAEEQPTGPQLGISYIKLPVVDAAATGNLLEVIAPSYQLQSGLSELHEKVREKIPKLEVGRPAVPQYGPLYESMGTWAYLEVTPRSSFPQGSMRQRTDTFIPWHNNMLKHRYYRKSNEEDRASMFAVTCSTTTSGER